MRILSLSSTDIDGGAAVAAFRLHKGLQSICVDSNMFVQSKAGKDKKVMTLYPGWMKQIISAMVKFDSVPLLAYPKRKRTIFSPAILPNNLYAKVKTISPDILNLHWITGGYMRIETLQKFKIPMVWTLHDMWPFTGGCHYDEECSKYTEICGRCPQLGSLRQKDLSYSVFARKMKAWQRLDLTIVAPSRWLAECARSSTLFKNFPVEIIPYGLDTEIYKPIPKENAREVWGFPQDKKLILFGGVNAASDKRKGFQFLEPAIRELTNHGFVGKLEIVIFGSSAPDNPPDFGFKAHYMGHLHDDKHLATLYSAADLFIAPSLQDNLPNTVMESLSCGTPVVAFNIGGIPDMVEHRINGYLAKAQSTTDLACGIKWVLEGDNRSTALGDAGRKKAVKEYSLEVQARRYLDVYNELLSRKKETFNISTGRPI